MEIFCQKDQLVGNLLSGGRDPLASGCPIPEGNIGVGKKLVNVLILPSIKNCWLQVLPVAPLEVALPTSSPDVVKLLRPDQLRQTESKDFFHLIRFFTHLDSAGELMVMESMQNLRQ